MPFEGGSNSTYTKEYVLGNDAAVTLNGSAQWNATGGHDGKGAYEFDSEGDVVYTHEGFRPGDEEMIKEEIENYL